MRIIRRRKGEVVGWWFGNELGWLVFFVCFVGLDRYADKLSVLSFGFFELGLV